MNASALHEQREITVQTEYEFGHVLAVQPDLDGNLIDEILVSDQNGEINIMFLDNDGWLIRIQVLNETSGNVLYTCGEFAGFGKAVASLGDLNGDGVCDVRCVYDYCVEGDDVVMSLTTAMPMHVVYLWFNTL